MPANPSPAVPVAPSTPPPRRPLVWLAVLTIGAGVWLAAAQLSFLCDDAFITFRYVANARDGHGLVWNRPPFAPVEGYTCFSWAMLLWAVWSWFGVEPQVAANPLSLGIGLALYAVVAVAALRLCRGDGTRLPLAVALTTLLVAASNRSFLQWMTSGLETSLFNLLIVAWVLQAFRRRTNRATWLLTWSTLAAGTALTRPDGLLCAAATAAAALLATARRQLPLRTTLIGLTPLLAVVAHTGWRRWFYGEWLPNTYFAKIVTPWPEAGLHYLACFAAEHGTWLVLAIALLWLSVTLLRRTRWLLRCAIDHPAPTAAVAAMFAQVGYYVLKVGGDHFEYRVFSHLVPLGALAVTAMAAQLTTRSTALLATTAAMLLASSAGWLHFAATRDLPSHGFQPLHKVLPTFLAPAARWFDRHQAWLLFHNIGLRCEQHARILERFARPLPERAPAASLPDPFPVLEYGAVGLVGWNLPDVAIIDHHGLNDWVVARTPIHSDTQPLDSAAIRPALQAVNADGDEWLDEGELRRALALLSGGDGEGDAADFLVWVMLAVHGHHRADALTLDEAEQIGAMLSRSRSMAHERHPPPGYAEAFEPNVAIVDRRLVVTERATPMTAQRIRAIEAEWRRRARDGELLPR